VYLALITDFLIM